VEKKAEKRKEGKETKYVSPVELYNKEKERAKKLLEMLTS